MQNFPTTPLSGRRDNRAGWRLGLAAMVVCLLASGCGRIHRRSSAEYVYVVVQRAFLRDRVAVVANRVADVANGERLQVLEHGRRFLRVKTPQGAVGWLEDHAVIDQSEFDAFEALGRQHAGQQPVATAVLYNELYAHIAPGRKTQRFYLFAANTKVAMLERASVPRQAAAGVLGLNPPAVKPRAAAHPRKGGKGDFEASFLPAVPMEDWWLVRDASGRTGWMLARDLAVDVPDDVAQYAEGQRMIGAYVLRTVEDPESGKPNGQVPEYLTVLTPYKDGLPFDFDQVRVFTWDAKRHRYGTAYRLRDIAGFFPVTVTTQGGALGASQATPVFSIQVAAGNQATLDPQTGMPHAAALETWTYRLDGNLVHRVEPNGGRKTSTSGATPGQGAAAHRMRRRGRIR